MKTDITRQLYDAEPDSPLYVAINRVLVKNDPNLMSMMKQASSKMCLTTALTPGFKGFDLMKHKAEFDQWVSSTEANLGKEFADETIIHIRDEYSTCDWILEGMLERSGFAIKEKRTLKTMPGTTYICVRNGV